MNVLVHHIIQSKSDLDDSFITYCHRVYDYILFRQQMLPSTISFVFYSSLSTSTIAKGDSAYKAFNVFVFFLSSPRMFLLPPSEQMYVIIWSVYSESNCFSPFTKGIAQVNFRCCCCCCYYWWWWSNRGFNDVVDGKDSPNRWGGIIFNVRNLFLNYSWVRFCICLLRYGMHWIVKGHNDSSYAHRCPFDTVNETFGSNKCVQYQL